MRLYACAHDFAQPVHVVLLSDQRIHQQHNSRFAITLKCLDSSPVDDGGVGNRLGKTGAEKTCRCLETRVGFDIDDASCGFRQLLTAHGKSVTATACDVGYESPTQFSREYARAFSLPPTQDAAPLVASFRASVSG